MLIFQTSSSSIVSILNMKLSASLLGISLLVKSCKSGKMHHNRVIYWTIAIKTSYAKFISTSYLILHLWKICALIFFRYSYYGQPEKSNIAALFIRQFAPNCFNYYQIMTKKIFLIKICTVILYIDMQKSLKIQYSSATCWQIYIIK